MKLRTKKDNMLCSSSAFNTAGVGEIIVYFLEEECGFDDMTTDFTSNYDAWLEQSQQWKDLDQAFKDHDVIPDNYNTRFGEPNNAEERERGWSD